MSLASEQYRLVNGYALIDDEDLVIQVEKLRRRNVREWLLLPNAPQVRRLSILLVFFSALLMIGAVVGMRDQVPTLTILLLLLFAPLLYLSSQLRSRVVPERMALEAISLPLVPPSPEVGGISQVLLPWRYRAKLYHYRLPFDTREEAVRFIAAINAT